MPRTPRIEYEDAAYHVTAHAVSTAPLFKDDVDREIYLAELAKAVAKHQLSCHGYCLMGNHVHLELQTPKANLAHAMQSLHGRYAQIFNRRHKLCGHVFDSRYYAVLIESDPQRLELSRYDALNPPRARLCERPEQYAWGSYRAAIGLVAAPAFLDLDGLLLHFGDTPALGAARLRQFVEDGLASDRLARRPRRGQTRD